MYLLSVHFISYDIIKFVDGLFTLATAIIDYKGHRMVAQSMIPGKVSIDDHRSELFPQEYSIPLLSCTIPMTFQRK